MNERFLEIVSNLVKEWDGLVTKLEAESRPLVLQDVRDYLMELAKIHSRAIVAKSLLLSWSLADKNQFESASKAWIMKGFAAEERKTLWVMGSENEHIKQKVELIIDGCNAMTRYFQHMLTVFQIEAKLSYVGHD